MSTLLILSTLCVVLVPRSAFVFAQSDAPEDVPPDNDDQDVPLYPSNKLVPVLYLIYPADGVPV